MSEIVEQKGLGLIVGTSLNGVIGREGDIPWHQPADLAYFRKVTTGKAIVMGRKTWDSIGRPLPKRRNIVLTRDKRFQAEGADVFHDLDDLLADLVPEDTLIIGGGEIYSLALPKVQTLYWTKVLTEVEGDASFSVPSMESFELVSSVFRERDEKNAFDMRFEVYQRKVV